MTNKKFPNIPRYRTCISYVHVCIALEELKVVIIPSRFMFLFHAFLNKLVLTFCFDSVLQLLRKCDMYLCPLKYLLSQVLF